MSTKDTKSDKSQRKADVLEKRLDDQPEKNRRTQSNAKSRNGPTLTVFGTEPRPSAGKLVNSQALRGSVAQLCTIIWYQACQWGMPVGAATLFGDVPTLWPGKEFAMFWSIFAILLILWLLGFGYRVGGWSIHLLLVAAMLVLIVHIWRPDILHRR